MKQISIFLMALIFSVNLMAQSHSQTIKNIQFDIEQIKVVGEDLLFNLLITNKSEDVKLNIRVSDCQMFDEAGNQYKANVGILGAKKAIGVSTMSNVMIKDVPVKASLRFTGAPSKREKIKVLEVNASLPETREKVNAQFRELTVPYGLTTSKEFLSKPHTIEVAEKVYLQYNKAARSGDQLHLLFMITNMNDDQKIFLKSALSRMIDAQGNEYKMVKAIIGQEKINYGSHLSCNLVHDVPQRIDIYFEDSKINSMKGIKLLELMFGNNKSQLFNLPIE